VRRHEDWQTRLSQFLASRQSVPFSYGSHDCCLFVADAVIAMTGTDLALQFRTKYRTRLGALRRLNINRGGVAAIASAVMIAYRCPEIAIRAAGRGDVILLQMPEGDILGLVSLNGTFVAAADRGFIEVPRALARRAWRI
jgi:hypothetical protein